MLNIIHPPIASNAQVFNLIPWQVECVRFHHQRLIIACVAGLVVLILWCGSLAALYQHKTDQRNLQQHRLSNSQQQWEGKLQQPPNPWIHKQAVLASWHQLATSSEWLAHALMQLQTLSQQVQGFPTQWQLNHQHIQAPTQIPSQSIVLQTPLTMSAIDKHLRLPKYFTLLSITKQSSPNNGWHLHLERNQVSPPSGLNNL